MNETTLPRLQKSGRTTQLIVDSKSFLILGGELGNSSASDPNEIGPMFARLRAMHLNTVLTPVYWDRFEPVEGTFDTSLVAAAIDSARAHDLRLVLLWFGTWKNSMSCYAPGWLKRDTARFTRVRRRSGEPLEIVSPQCVAARDADARAFAELMRWLKEYDGDRHTVVMVQVENEIGMIPEARDHSPLSEAAYLEPVPEALLSLLTSGELGPEVTALWQAAGSRTEGRWGEIFGDSPQGDEVFSAWQFATFVEVVAAAGKREYPLPLFTNAALIRPGYEPGRYPSAGPLPHLLEIWRAGAPSLDMFSPDIYFPNFSEWCVRYVRGGNPLFIPEMAASERVTANAVYAIGQHAAMGIAPFAIEDTDKAPQLANLYWLLDGLATRILDAQRDGSILALSPPVGFDWSVPVGPERGEHDSIVFEATFDQAGTEGGDQTTVLPTLGAGRWEAPAGTPCGAVLILRAAEEEYFLLGRGAVVTFHPADGSGKVGIESAQEGEFGPDGAWIGRRWLNGDQTHQGRHIRFPDGAWSIQRVRLYWYG